jgi:hypothetical protein
MKFILGDNPFFGVNHRVGSKKLLDVQYRFENASNVIQEAALNDFDSIMVATHPNYVDLLDLADKSLSDIDKIFNLNLMVPYPHSINDILHNSGYYGLFKAFSKGKVFEYVLACLRFLFGNKKKLYSLIFMSIIDIELKKIGHLQNFKLEYVSLHNVIADILIGSKNIEILEGFVNAVYKFGYKPVVISQNPVHLLNLKFDKPFVRCFTYNSNGYMVNPNLEEVNKSVINYNTECGELWAMQILASGSIEPHVAFENAILSKFNGIIYATTKKERIVDFLTEAKKHFI